MKITTSWATKGEGAHAKHATVGIGAALALLVFSAVGTYATTIAVTDTTLLVEHMRAVGGTIMSFAILLVAFLRVRRECRQRLLSEGAAREGEENLATILMSIGDGVIATDIEGRLVRMNRVAEELTGWTAAASVGKPAAEIFRVIDAETRATVPDPIERALREGAGTDFDGPRLLARSDGSEIPITVSCTLIRGTEGVVHGAVLVFRDVSEAQWAKTFFRALVEKGSDGIALTTPDGALLDASPAAMVDDPAVGAIVRNVRDVTERKRAEEALRVSEARFARLSESGLVGIAVADLAGNIADANDACLRALGYSRADLRAGKVRWPSMTPPEWTAMDIRATEQLKTTGVTIPWEKELFRQDGSRVPVLLGAAMLDDQDSIAFIIDLSERKQAQKALRESEEQLRQAQKMEAVGRLAGGVAHDFNNMLSVILSYSNLVLEGLKPDDPVHADVQEIQKAGLRAAALTRQLLMFSRQQVIEPKVVDVNDVLSDIDRMLQRMLGEDIEITLTKLSTASVLVDPSGIEQVVMNLVVNARDAMPTGGKLTIETADVVLDDDYARHHVGVVAGPHVMLAVTDTGTGMDAATRARIFEPFFTTKEKGKGTGLGLSTVFGIAAQSGGSVWVYSELGLGTTFKVYLPRATSDATAPAVVVAPATLRGTETVLLVEDEDQVRAVARGILTRSGYKVIEARNAAEALLSCEQHTGAIDLLLSDVVMPKMSGPVLAKRLAAERPAMRVLCMSGYTDDSIVRHGMLEAHLPFLQKPITPETLTRKVREVLDSARAA